MLYFFFSALPAACAVNSLGHRWDPTKRFEHGDVLSLLHRIPGT